MPAFLQSFIEAEQERSRRIEQLRKEIREFAKEEAGSSITEQILLFLADEMVEHLSEIDYELRMKFELYITPLIKRNYIYRYTGTFDRIRQAYIRERMKTPAGQRECEWKYKNEILFVPYHSDPVIVKSVETVRCRSNMVWNFKAAASEKLKRQIFTVLEYILKNYEISRLREYKLTGLQLFYEFCIREQITDIQLLELEQETAFQDYLKQKVEKEQRRKRLKSIVETARKVIFIETDETRWDATIWYLERFRIAKERINQSDSIEKISFQEVLQPKNRLLLQEYMKYEIGIGELALSTVYERFRTIRNFLQEISELEVTKCDASLIDVYLKNLQNGAMGAKTFNTNVSGIQFFMKFLEVKGYIKKVPFYASYYLEKQIPVHHDRSVEEDVYMEIIQNLSQFPEHLRMMFLHLWCVGLRISEVCTLKGDAYYIQNGDCWMKVYQVKMKNYKRVPIPVTLYRLMQVYLKKHPTEKEAYIFRNRKGGAFSKSTFMGQMKKYCSQIGIQNGEYIFKSHDYRHTVATNFYEHGVSIQSIRDYLGHTFEEMTMQYIDYMPRKIAKENDAYFEEEENSLLPLFDNKAFREAVINAVLHNKWVEGNEPMISVFSDRIEILSRGTLAPAQTMEGFFLGESIPVNEKLSEIFLQLHISEKSGRGVPKITEMYGKDAFSFRENSIVVTIPFERINKVGNKVGKKVGDKKSLNSRRQKIISEMRDNPNITTAELHNILGVSETAVENNISFLRENGYIERVGSKKAGYWKVL